MCSGYLVCEIDQDFFPVRCVEPDGCLVLDRISRVNRGGQMTRVHWKISLHILVKPLNERGSQWNNGYQLVCLDLASEIQLSLGPRVGPADCTGSGRDVQGLWGRLSKIAQFLCGGAAVWLTPFPCLLQGLSCLHQESHAWCCHTLLSLGGSGPSLGCGDLALWVPLWGTSFSRVRADGGRGFYTRRLD